MSVKSKVKRCNKKILELEQQINRLTTELCNKTVQSSSKETLYENIIKFAITNHIGGLHGGMMVDYFGIDKMKSLRLDIESSPIEHAYIMRVRGGSI